MSETKDERRSAGQPGYGVLCCRRCGCLFLGDELHHCSVVRDNILMKLRVAIRAERRAGNLSFRWGEEETTDAALAAVEQEMAALTQDRDHCQRLYLEACEMGSGHARIAALEAELVELRKRPTLEEVQAAIQEEYNRDWNGPIVRPYTDVLRVIRELYFRRGLSPFYNLSAPAEKAAQ